MRSTRTPVTGPAATPAPAPSAVQIARALGQPDPTPEQQAVIEAPLQPLLVVAGAGSGKTETMAARVVWLVAAGLVRPGEILGLTFTRKAAGELSDRIRARLRRLRSAGLLPRPCDTGTDLGPGADSGADDSGTDDSGADDHEGEATVSTYHAFAGRIVREHGLRLGVEPDARLVSQAAAWQLASEVVARWDGPMGSVDYAVSTVTAAVLDLAGECAEHLVDTAQIDDLLAERIAWLLALPYDGSGSGRRSGAPPVLRPRVRELVTRLEARRQILPLVQAYRRLKRERDSLDFGDQVALAAELAASVPQLVLAERSRARAVLLDEYQDTSHAQLVLLHALFGDGHGVSAVGDPHQSIYGWRGASAGTLLRFAQRFRDTSGKPAQVLALSTSWRNDRAVLDAANAVAAPLRAQSRVSTPVLSARPTAAAGRVLIRSFETVEDEARAIAEHLAGVWWDASGAHAQVSAAVLCRKRSQFEAVEAALRERGLPVEVVGLGGLLSTPEVADLLAALHVVHDPTRGDRLMRLLTGAGVRLGPRDLMAFGSWSRQLHRRQASRADGGDVVADEVDESSLVEALDDLPPPGWRDAQGRSLSAAGAQRLAALAARLRTLRSRTALPLPELVVETERALLLDVEVASRPGMRLGAARAHLDALGQVASDFAASAQRPTLGAFLAWLEAADEHERGLEPGQVEVDPDAVQLMTVHGAKGLEWDVVAVPGLVEGTFPAHRARARYGPNGWQVGEVTDTAWLGALGSVPHELRGDADGLPDVRWSTVTEQPDVAAALDDFGVRAGRHELAEERRLAYVALTRARRELLLTTHVWSDGTTPRVESRFVTELRERAGVDCPGVNCSPAPAQPGPEAVNPRTATARTAVWPNDPLGPRRAPVEAGAALVRAASAAPADAGQPTEPTAESLGWERAVGILLAERDRHARSELDVSLPSHLSASRLVQLAADPQALALHLRRPMPRRPEPAARRGTAFHAWVEQRLGVSAMLDVLDLPGAADERPAPDADLATLQRNFLASEWAEREVLAVEVAIETPIDGTVVRGRVDAVFARPAGGVDVVDWKTGAVPHGPEAAARAVQLAAYRLGWSRLHAVPLDHVGAAFFYAATGDSVRPVDLLDEAGLVALLRGVDAVG